MWWGDGGAYFVCSFARFEDGSAAQHDGQIPGYVFAIKGPFRKQRR